MDKDKRIKQEIDELNKLFRDVPKEKMKLTEGLIQNAAFMRVTLEELQREVVEKGACIQYTSGNGFETIKDNPAQKAYTTMVSRYTQIISQLQNMLPATSSSNDDLLDFLND